MLIKNEREIVRDSFGLWISGLFSAVCAWNKNASFTEKRVVFLILERLLSQCANALHANLEALVNPCRQLAPFGGLQTFFAPSPAGSACPASDQRRCAAAVRSRPRVA